MREHNHKNNQLSKEIQHVFFELEITKHLRKAGITKGFGFGTSNLFQLIFCLVFQHKSWFTLLQSKKGDQYPAKDTVYRFLNHSKFAWYRFFTFLNVHIIQKVSVLTNVNRPKILIIDDSMYDRNRSKKVELLVRCRDHSSTGKRFYKGFRMLTLGWSDGATLSYHGKTVVTQINSQSVDSFMN